MHNTKYKYKISVSTTQKQIIKQSEKSLTGRLQWLKQRWLSQSFLSKQAYKAKEEAVSLQKALVTSGVHHARRLQRFIDDELLATGDQTLAKKIMEQLQNKNLKNYTFNLIVFVVYFVLY